MDKESEEKKAFNDAHNRTVARRASWLNDVFQEANLSADQKAIILRKVSEKFNENLGELSCG